MKRKFNLVYFLQFLFIVFSAFLTGYLLEAAQTNTFKYSAQVVFQNYFGPYLLTVVILLLVYLGIYGLINRFFYATAIFYGFFTIYGVSNRLKVQYRGEPVLPSDLTFLSSLKKIAGMVSPTALIILAVSLVVIIVICIVLEKHFGKHLMRMKPWSRIVFILLSVLSIGSFYTANEENSLTSKALKSIGFENFAVNINWSANNNGPMLTFLSNMHVKVMDQPKDYSQKTMMSLVKKYQKEADAINHHRPNNNLKDQTLVFVLSESFADPTRVPNLKLNQDPIPKIQQVKKQNTSGLMLSSGYGGGTANMEYMTLTGLALNQFSKSLQTPYTQLVGKQQDPINIADGFDSSTVIHPFYANLYNRQQVYQKFGFKKYRNIESTGNSTLPYLEKKDGGQFVSDESAYADTLWQINHVQSGQFINLITIQNHLPYTTDYPNNQFSISGTAPGKEGRQVKNYAKSVNMSDDAVADFLKQLDQINKPITIVWYGDHLPGIYDGNNMKKYNVPMHETDYFVYSNQYAIDHGYGSQKLDSGTSYTDPNGFIPLALKQMKQKVTPYSALLTKVQEDLPAMARNSVGSDQDLYVDAKGKQIASKQLTKKQQQLLHDYQLLQYDLTAGNGYSKKIINK